MQPGTVLKQHYELIRKLGAGGMGMVFLARDIRLGRLVAIQPAETSEARSNQHTAVRGASAGKGAWVPSRQDEQKPTKV